jgi:hypothetical protein
VRLREFRQRENLPAVDVLAPMFMWQQAENSPPPGGAGSRPMAITERRHLAEYRWRDLKPALAVFQ